MIFHPSFEHWKNSCVFFNDVRDWSQVMSSNSFRIYTLNFSFSWNSVLLEWVGLRKFYAWIKYFVSFLPGGLVCMWVGTASYSICDSSNNEFKPSVTSSPSKLVLFIPKLELIIPKLVWVSECYIMVELSVSVQWRNSN